MDDIPLVSPEKFIYYMCARNNWTLEDVKISPTVVVALPTFLEIFKQLSLEKVEKSIFENHYRIPGSTVSIKESRVGCPSMAIDLEDMVYLGGSQFIHLGFAGGLHDDMNPGDIVITEGVFNEAGIPSLYGITDLMIPSDPVLTKALTDAARAQNIPVRLGTHWCTDAVYRETREKVKKYVKEGALCVEMEGSALFAVSKFYSVSAAAVYVLTDIIKEDGWHQDWHSDDVKTGCRRVVDFVSSFIQNYPQSEE